MARGKKKESLTLEEKLEAALVPEEEQPYKVPGNWCWTYIKTGFEVTSSKRVHKSDWIEKGIPFYRTRELVKLSAESFVDNELFISEKLYDDLVMNYGKPQIGDLLISGVGTIGVPYVVKTNDKFYFKDGNVIWLKNKYLFDPDFVFYLYKSIFMQNQIYGMSAGTTVDTYTIVNANQSKIPLPPLAEQHRIVERIESLFSQLDEARDKAQEALDSFKIRKSSLLQKAFAGELTEKWRKENSISFDTWESMPLESVCESIYDGDHMPPPKSEDGIPFLVISNVNDGYLSFENTRFVPEDYYNSLSNTRKPEKGDVLYTLVGSYGIPVVVDSDKSFCFQRHMGLLKPRKVDTYFLWYQMQSDVIYQKASAIATGTAQITVPIKGLRKIEIAVPTKEEQQEIVKILDDVLGQERKMQEDIAAIIEQIESVKKSILAKAFRGELGTNDPEDENAVELLKAVLKEQ